MPKLGRTRNLRAAALAPVVLILCGCVPAPTLLRDLETQRVGSYPGNITPAASGFYLSAMSGQLGTELAFYTGSHMLPVEDLGPDTTSGYPSGIFTNGDRAFFRADDGTDNNSATTYSLFVTDGGGSTVRLTNPISQIASDAFVGFATWGASGVLFTMKDPTYGIEIFRSDGTVPGTQLVSDITPGTGSSGPAEFTKLGSYWYFSATDGSTGRELWRTDGTTTNRVIDLNPGTNQSQPRGLAVWNGKLYFGADQGATFRRGLYASDGTAGGTTLITDKSDDNFRPETVTATPSRIFFMAYYSELWKSDGTAGGTVALKTFTPDSEGNVPTDFLAVGDRVVFHVPTDSGLEIWGSNGTAGGTVQLGTNLDTGSGQLAVHNGFAYFTVGDALYKTDGTVAGTSLVFTQAGLAPTNLASALGKLYFSGNDNTYGRELWSSDGTAGGTAFEWDANDATDNSYPTSYVRAGSYTFFTATTKATGRELWRTDGTNGGTILLKDIKAGTADSSPSQMKAWNGILYFTADNGTSGVELWKSDGTPAGTVMVKDIRAGATGSTPGDVYAGPNYLYFYADDGSGVGAELWRSDGTSGGTVLVKDINAGASASTPRFFGTVGTKVCFQATTVTEGRELWCSDGTTGGTVLTKDIRTGTSSSSMHETPLLVGSYLYFGANDGTNGDELWRSDGTTGGTTRVTDIAAGSASTSPRYFAVMNGSLYFNGYNGTRYELWRTDGTTHTMLSGAINNTPYSNPGNLTAVGSTVFFGATDPTKGYELFSTDGTVVGTKLVKDINPIAGKSNNLNYLTAVGGTLFFAATDGTTGTELWRSDGTTAGTVLASGQGGDFHASNPTNLAASNGVLYVTLDDATYGTEPFTCTE